MISFRIIIELLLSLTFPNSIFSELDNQLSSDIDSIKEDYTISCPGGVLLSPTICIPREYRKGELPSLPMEINTALEVNDLRKFDDNKMTVSMKFHPQLVWEDMW